MRYWWVNQKKTYRHEVPGNYLWSPKRNRGGGPNPFYDFMREVAPGDVVFSFADTRIRAIGRVVSHGYEAPKPKEFGQIGAYWEEIGWRVDVIFAELKGPIRPVEHMDVLGPLLPDKYSPLQATRGGQQNMYLTSLQPPLARRLVDLIGREARHIVKAHFVADEPLHQPAIGLIVWEEHELARVRSDEAVPETTREAVVLARRGQGLFKKNVQQIETACRITRVDQEQHLRASHCKPWRDGSNEERLDGENGLLLTPSIDHLFDRGFIGFEDNGDLIISPVAHIKSLTRMGIKVGRRRNVGGFSEGQRRYLEYHRENVLLKSKYLEES